MPLFASSHPNDRYIAQPHPVGPRARFSVTGETTGLQVTAADVHETRKRSRFDGAPDPTFSTPHTPSADSWGRSLSYTRGSSVRSPPPLADDRYELAGGAETMDRFTRQNGDYDDYFLLGKQRGMWIGSATPGTELPMSSHLYADGVAATPVAKPWVVNSIMNIVGGVAGKLFQFCTVPFRGFQAGGGKAYMFEANQEVAAKLGFHDGDLNRTAAPIQQPVPGNFPEDDYGVLSIESVDTERPRMSKRQKTGDSWVVVDENGGTISRPSTPRLSGRRVPSHTRSPSQIPRPVSRASLSTPKHKRPSLIPVSRRSTMDRRAFQQSTKVSVQAEGSPRCYSRQSYGSPVMFETKTSKTRSPLPPESQRLINKMRREELEDDARMRRMSSQMSDMLREAREALGSKIEIEDEYMDEDSHDDVYSRQMRLYPR